MRPLSIKLHGEKELLKKLATMKGPELKKALRKGLRAGAKIVQTASKSNVDVKSGRLKRSIKVRAGKRHRTIVRLNVAAQFQSAEDFYGSFPEMGTKYIKAPTEGMKRAASDRGKQALGLAIDETKKFLEGTFGK